MRGRQGPSPRWFRPRCGTFRCLQLPRGMAVSGGWRLQLRSDCICIDTFAGLVDCACPRPGGGHRRPCDLRVRRHDCGCVHLSSRCTTGFVVCIASLSGFGHPPRLSVRVRLRSASANREAATCAESAFFTDGQKYGAAGLTSLAAFDLTSFSLSCSLVESLRLRRPTGVRWTARGVGTRH